MRQIDQLLTIVLEELKKEKKKKKKNESLFSFTGLCHFFRKLRNTNLITHEEDDVLYLFIQMHRPGLLDVCTLSTFWHHCQSAFFFTSGKITPRIHYVKWLLKKIKNDSI